MAELTVNCNITDSTSGWFIRRTTGIFTTWSFALFG